MSILTALQENMSLVTTAKTCHFPPSVSTEHEVCLVSDDIYNNSWVFIRSLLTLGISIECSPKLEALSPAIPALHVVSEAMVLAAHA